MIARLRLPAVVGAGVVAVVEEEDAAVGDVVVEVSRGRVGEAGADSPGHPEVVGFRARLVVVAFPDHRAAAVASRVPLVVAGLTGLRNVRPVEECARAVEEGFHVPVVSVRLSVPAVAVSIGHPSAAGAFLNCRPAVARAEAA